jgi:hypothetical protein
MIVGENVPIGFGDGEFVTERDMVPTYGPTESIPGLVTQQDLYSSSTPSSPVPGLVTQRDLYAPSATPSEPIPGLVTPQQIYAPAPVAQKPATATMPAPAPRGAAGRPAGKPAQGGARGVVPMMKMPQGGQKPQGAFAATGGGMFDNLPPWAPYAMLAGGVVLATVILVMVIPSKSTPTA